MTEQEAKLVLAHAVDKVKRESTIYLTTEDVLKIWGLMTIQDYEDEKFNDILDVR